MARLKKHPGRKRRMAGWFVLAWAAVFAGLWVASRWWNLQMSWRSNSVVAVSGGFVIDMLPGDMQFPSRVRANSNTMTPVWVWWYWQWSNASAGRAMGLFVIFPGWLVPGVLTIVGVPLLRSGIIARCARIGICRKCGYALAGLPPGSPCPECGTVA